MPPVGGASVPIANKEKARLIPVAQGAGLKLIGIWEPAAIAAGQCRSFCGDQVRWVILAVCRGLVIAREEIRQRLGLPIGLGRRPGGRFELGEAQRLGQPSAVGQ